MATQKEMNALIQLVRTVAEVNASSDRVNVHLDITRSSVSVRISDPVEVLACSDYTFNWLFYDDKAAYFSSEFFEEDAFLERCQEFTAIIKGFEGRTVSEVSQ